MVEATNKNRKGGEVMNALMEEKTMLAEIPTEEKREVDEIVEAIKKLPKNARTRMFYMIQGAQLIADNSNTQTDRAVV